MNKRLSVDGYYLWGFCNSFPPSLVEVVGNINDNPELLEAEK